MLGPFKEPPFNWMVTSPLMTREKKGTTNRRVIMDLSFPEGKSVNSGVDKTTFMGEKFSLELPGPIALREILKDREVTYLWTMDVSRAYRQLRSDPLDLPLLGLTWQGKFYIDLAVPFGLRHGARNMQSVSVAFVEILKNLGIVALPYIDDIVGVANTKKQAEEDLATAVALMEELGIQEATGKRSNPSRITTWLGIEFDTIQRTMRIPKNKIDECLNLTKEWLQKNDCSISQLRSLLGKFFHVASCCRVMRLFLNRLLDALRGAEKGKKIILDKEFKEDLRWIRRFLPSFNGVDFIDAPLEHTKELVVDACLTGVGGTLGQLWYEAEIPRSLQEKAFTIAELEMLNILVAMRVFSKELRNCTIKIRSDNAASVLILQTGKGRCKNMMDVARSIWWLATQNNVLFSISHIFGRDNVYADALSRGHLDEKNRKKLQELKDLHRPTMRKVKDDYFEFQNSNSYTKEP